MYLIDIFDHMAPRQHVKVVTNKSDVTIYDSIKDSEIAPDTAILHVENIAAHDDTVVIYVY